MDDELQYVLDNYQDIIREHLGIDIAVCFFAECEKVTDSIEAVKRPTTRYSLPPPKDSAVSATAVNGIFNVLFYQDFSLQGQALLSDCNICHVGSYEFLRIITPFTRKCTYDFLIMKLAEAEAVLKELKTRAAEQGMAPVDFPVIGIDFSDIKKETIDFLQNEEFRAFCRSKNIKLKRGLIFEGNPGNGKSLSLKWLRLEAEKAGICFHQFQNIDDFINNRDQYYDRSQKHIFVFEDFDTLLRERKDTNNSPNELLGMVLNTLDGVDEIEDVVSIFTTNKLSLFDSAFIRPGRIDKVITFADPGEQETLNFFRAYIPGYEKYYADIINFIQGRSTTVSYAVLKGICDDINIAEFGKQRLDRAQVLEIAAEKLAAADKNRGVRKNQDYIL